MFCPKCGAQNADDSQFCSKCGAGLVQPAAPAAAPAPPPAAPPAAAPAAGAKTSGMAIASLIMGILALIFLTPLGILSIIFGGIGISQTGKDPNLKGKGLAVAGLIMGIVAILVWIASWIWWTSLWWWW